MNSKRVYFLMVGLLVLLGVALLGGAYGANALLQQRAKKLTDLKLQEQAVGQQQLSLAKAKQDIQQYASLEKIAQSIVPQDKDQAEAVRELVNIAGQNGIKLSNISFPSSTLGAGSSSGSGSSSSSSSPLTQVTPVSGMAGVYQLQINVQQDSTQPITYAQFIGFLTALENNRRTAQVSSISILPTSDRSHLTFTLSLNEYIKP
ncbi:MAG TPA: hypothetical protein VHT70_00615 [Candidatus Saccharimonadales bacterium]|jgi:hypothetical protein|nr:hypothetical protein [Candidatus Saccharimonadales bacterium]